MNSREINSQLNDLILCLQDSCHGCSECAKNVNAQSIKNLFNMLSSKREMMLNDLKNFGFNIEIETFTKNGTIAGKAHQLFVNLKALLMGNNIDAILTEVKRGENKLIETYNVTIKNDLPLDLQTILTSQLNEIKRDLAEIDKLMTNTA